jgi:hypothetical protein
VDTVVYALNPKLLNQEICFAEFFGSTAVRQSAIIRSRIKFGMVIAQEFRLSLSALVKS